MHFKKKETAIVLVEFQKQWTEKGLFNRLIKQQLESRSVVKNTWHLVTKSREKGIKIIHAPVVVDTNNKKGLLAHLTLGQIFTKGTWKSEIVPGLFNDSDPIAPRLHYSFKAFNAFFKSGLEQILKNNKIRNFFICGFATDQSPAKTLQAALNKGFNAYLVSDCTATYNEFSQKMIENSFGERIVSSNELLSGLH